MKPKVLNRLRLILLNSANSFLLPLGTMLISMLLVRYKSAALYGELAFILILFDFAFNIISWGDSGYLFRQFSLKPATIEPAWQQSFTSRIPLPLLFCLVVAFTAYSIKIKLCLCIWIVSRYVYRSCDVLFQYNRNYKAQLLIELVGIVFLVLPILIYLDKLTFSSLVLLYTFSASLKTGLALFYYKNIFSLLSFKMRSTSYFISAFPFLLITFSGMLESKADLYGVAYFLNKEELGKYQVLSGFLGFSQLGASLLLAPFGKNMFRLPLKTFKKVEALFAKSGILFSFIFVLGIYVALQFIYVIHLPLHMYAIAYLYVIPSFFYLPSLFACSKQNKQSTIVFITLMGSVANLLLGYFLTPLFRKEGALVAGAFTQWLIFILFICLRNRNQNFFRLKW